MARLRRGVPGRVGRRRYRRGLREIARRLGAVRDLDVLLEAADAYRADLPVAEQRGARAAARRLARPSRRRPGRSSLRELDCDRYRRWLDDYVEFVRTEGAAVIAGRADAAAPRPRHRAVAHLGRLRAGPGYEPVLRWADVETLHDLRIAGKWLRYTLEFVREALGDDAMPLIARVTALQDHLGLMHDADVTASMARTFLVEHAGDAEPGRERRDRPLPRRSRARAGPPAAHRSGRPGAAWPGPASGARSDGWSPGSSPAALHGAGSVAPAMGELRQPIAPAGAGVVGDEDGALAQARVRHAEARRRRSGRRTASTIDRTGRQQRPGLGLTRVAARSASPRATLVSVVRASASRLAGQDPVLDRRRRAP